MSLAIVTLTLCALAVGLALWLDLRRSRVRVARGDALDRVAATYNSVGAWE